MVGTSASYLHMDSASRRLIMQQMLKEREDHARIQRHDYSHVFRKKTNFEMLRLAAISMAIEFAYAAETAFASPLLLQNGINHQFMTMAWGLSPLVGFFMSPLLGSLSDRCKLAWGRRRPIITLLASGIVIGLVLLPFGKDLGLLIMGNNNNIYNESLTANVSLVTNSSIKELDNSSVSISAANLGAILTIIGMVLLDFGADTLQTPSRTYMLDMCTSADQSRGLTTFTMLAGIGGTIGYALGGIDWNTMMIGSFLGGNIHTVFVLVCLIFICCYIITVTTFREIPLKLIERDDLLMPLSNADIKFEMKQQQNNEKALNNNEQNETTDYSTLNNPETTTTTKDTRPTQKKITLKQYIKSIFIMPKSMRILAFTNLICWMAHVTYCLYFTDFVGEAVFGGDPKGDANSEPALLYEAGVRFGCFGLSVYALSCSIYSMCITKLLQWFRTKWVFIASIIYHAIGMFVLAIWPTKWGVILFSTSAGVLYGTLFTIPYILVANYHAKDCFRIRDGETVPLKQVRGLGTDVAIVSSMVFVAQLIVSLTVGPLVTYFITTQTILYLSSFYGFLAAISALFVFYI